MKISRSCPWDLSIETAIGLQKRLSRRLILKGAVLNPRWVAGADAAFHRGGTVSLGVVVVMDLRENKVVETSWAKQKVRFPYIPGLLAFREGPVLLECIRKIKNEPEAILFDGQGIAHPRRFGLACHLGYLLDRPTVGCAKSLLWGFHEPVEEKAGSEVLLWDENHRPIGVALRTQRGANPVYVSPGHRIGLKGALRVIRACLKGHRLPEPLYVADRLTKEALT